MNSRSATFYALAGLVGYLIDAANAFTYAQVNGLNYFRAYAISRLRLLIATFAAGSDVNVNAIVQEPLGH